MTYLGDLCVQHGVFRVGLLNDVTQILHRPSLVAVATKFNTIDYNSATATKFETK